VPYPVSPRQKLSKYFVVIFSDDSGQMQLAGFPMSKADYDTWESEIPKLKWIER
jgi:hypothetical protein